MLIFSIIIIILFSLFAWMSCKESFHEKQIYNGIMQARVLDDVYDVITKHGNKATNASCMVSSLGIVIGIVIGFGVLFLSMKDVPSALDVYRGKTELVIKTENTIKDSIIVSTPIDSVVVWKREIINF